jgi:methylated-DNA-[protein]-cysteine S-methyltransferase
MRFSERVYELLREVPKGKVTTYKALAARLDSKAYRAVGQALKNNPYAPEVPCHRVVRSDGSIGGFMGNTTGVEIKRKIQMLNAEGVEVKDGKIVDFKKYLFEG